MNEIEAATHLIAMDGSAGSEWLNMLMLMGGLGLIVYFTLIRPQANERKAHETMLTALTKGDRVVTKSGFYGKIMEVKETAIVVEIANKVSVTIEKTAIARLNVDKNVQAASK